MSITVDLIKLFKNTILTGHILNDLRVQLFNNCILFSRDKIDFFQFA